MLDYFTPLEETLISACIFLLFLSVFQVRKLNRLEKEIGEELKKAEHLSETQKVLLRIYKKFM
jgi:F0F1-type ATP synthase membrane subunit b/b'